MEPITHMLTGACLSRAGFNRRTRHATLAMVLAAEAPDLDMLINFLGPVTGFAHHRGITHTLLGSPFVAAFVVGFVYLLHKFYPAGFYRPGRKTTPEADSPPRWKVLFLLAWIAALSHILLDFTNNYGVRPFEPFSYRWYSWDIVFIYEPAIWMVLLLGLIMPALFALIAQEVGGKRERYRGRGGAIFALLGIIAVWGVRDFEHRQAIAALNSQVYEGRDPLKVAAMPLPISPFTWHGIVETDTLFETMAVDSLSGAVDAQGRAQIRYKPEETPITLAAKSSYLGQVYLDWARFPLLEVEQNTADRSFEVRFQDLRFSYNPINRGDSPPSRGPLGAAVMLDQNGKVVEQRFGSRVQR